MQQAQVSLPRCVAGTAHVMNAIGIDCDLVIMHAWDCCSIVKLTVPAILNLFSD